jgi:hypothetical protein
MSADLWGPIDVIRWEELPHLSGRLASETDVKAGRAVFCQQGQGVRMEPYPTQLPRPAILKLEASEEPVFVIQIEYAAHQIIVGYRNLGGGNGIATLPEVALLDAPDSRFVR